MDDASFHADCARCVGLCCVALAFDHSDAFGADKAAGTACPNLTGTHRCAIHERLEEAGYAGCARYDCLGAGPLVTAVFRGLSWGDGGSVARTMFRAFAVMREIQQARLLLVRAAPMCSSAEEMARQRDLLGQLEPEGGWTIATVMTCDPAPVALEAGAFVRAMAARLNGRLAAQGEQW